MVQKYEVGDCVYALMNGITRIAIVIEVVKQRHSVYYRIEAAGIRHFPLVSDKILYNTAWQAHKANMHAKLCGWEYIGDGGKIYKI